MTKKALSSKPDEPPTIKIWRFHDAPADFRRVCDDGGDEEWIVYIPPEIVAAGHVEVIRSATEFTLEIRQLGTLYGRPIAASHHDKRFLWYDGGIVFLRTH